MQRRFRAAAILVLGIALVVLAIATMVRSYTIIHAQNFRTLFANYRQQRQPLVALNLTMPFSLKNINANDFPNLSSCEPTEQIEILQSGNYWILETRTKNGTKKRVGGDEFFVTFYENWTAGDLPPSNQAITAAAFVEDRKDGTYALHFVASPFADHDTQSKQRNNSSSSSLVVISHDYTCGIGRMARDTKSSWHHGGLIGSPYMIHNVTPTIGPFVPPKLYNLSQYDAIVCFGDSVLLQFCGFEDVKRIFTVPNLTIHAPAGNMGSLIQPNKIQEALVKLNQTSHDILLQSNSSTAIILGSCAWDMSYYNGPAQGHYFNASLGMHRELVRWVREHYPQTDIYWKLPHAFHPSSLHQEACYKIPRCVDRVRYVSQSIARFFYDEQHEMEGVQFLDLWNASYLTPYKHPPSDVMHYAPDFNRATLAWFAR